MPQVSVILPNYNHATYLKARIESILNQSFQDFELLIFDDASTDESATIINTYKAHPRVSFIEIAENNSGSPFGAWEKGYLRAKGDYLWIAESDDLADKDFLSENLTSFESNKAVVVSFASSHWINEKDEKVHTPTHELEPYNENTSHCLQNEFTKGTFIYNMSSALIKKEAFSKVNFQLLRSYKYVGDWYFWAKIMETKGVVVRIPQALNYFRRHDSNVSFAADKNGLQFTEGFPVLLNILESQQVSFFKKQRIFAFWANKLYFSETQNKQVAVNLLPLWGKLWYSLVPFIAKRP